MYVCFHVLTTEFGTKPEYKMADTYFKMWLISNAEERK
jgi:hypothetical protein